MMSIETRNYRVDWPQLLDEIAHLLGEPDANNSAVRVPCGERRLAEYLGVDREAMRRWKAGSKVEYHDGTRFLATWARLTGKAETFAPRERTPLSAHKVSR